MFNEMQFWKDVVEFARHSLVDDIGEFTEPPPFSGWIELWAKKIAADFWLQVLDYLGYLDYRECTLKRLHSPEFLALCRHMYETTGVRGVQLAPIG